MFVGVMVDVLFGETKVDNVNCLVFLHTTPPNQEILRFHVPKQKKCVHCDLQKINITAFIWVREKGIVDSKKK